MMPDVSAPFHNHDHSGCARTVLEHAERLTRARGVRLTPVRRRTLEILLESHKAMGAYDMLDRLAADGFGKQPPVVYRALDFLVENGLAHRVQLLNAFTACMHPDTDHQPVFLICRACQHVAEAPAEPVRQALDQAARTLGFAVERSSLEATGLCPACSEAP